MNSVIDVTLYTTLISLIMAFDVTAQDSPIEDRTATNLEVMRALAEKIGEKVGETIGGSAADTLGVQVRPRETAWYLEAFLLKGLSKSDQSVVVSGLGDISIEFGMSSLRVEYTNVRSEGIFGSHIVDRRITVDISTRVVDERTRELIMTREFSESRQDTVSFSEIKELENPNLSVTQATLPGGGFFSGFVEPLIVLGAVAVAMLLLFSVRS